MMFEKSKEYVSMFFRAYCEAGREIFYGDSNEESSYSFSIEVESIDEFDRKDEEVIDYLKEEFPEFVDK